MSNLGGSGPGPHPNLSQLVSRPYKLFISHAWDYGSQYDGLVKLLRTDLFFHWVDLSVSEDNQLPTHPLLQKSFRYLVRQLDEKIQQADCVLVIAGMYFSHRGWIQSEIEAAREFRKPIIAIKPWGNEKMPAVLSAQILSADDVAWNRQSIISSIRQCVGPVSF